VVAAIGIDCFHTGTLRLRCHLVQPIQQGQNLVLFYPQASELAGHLIFMVEFIDQPVLEWTAFFSPRGEIKNDRKEI
jgi:hypothetical protein